MNDPKLQVCLIAPVPPPYGGMSHWTLMMRDYAVSRSDVRLFIVNTAPRWRAVYDLRTMKRLLGGFIQFIRNIFRLIGVIINRHPHVVHLTTSGQYAIFRDFGVILVADLFRIPVVYHLHFGRVPMLISGNTLEWRFLAFALRRAHTIIAIDSATEDAIHLALPNVNIVKIPNCIDLERISYSNILKKNEHIVMYLGWVIPTKGIEELMEAWSLLNLKDWRLHIVGPCDPSFQEELLNQHHFDNVEFIGEKKHDEAMKLLASADLFVLPSYTEGFPNVVLEAMVLGKPIIATRVGAIPEMLAGGCGVLVKPKDVTELKDALNRVLNDSKLRSSLGKCARFRVEAEYSLDFVFSRYMSIWQQAAQKKVEDFHVHK